MKRGNVDWRKRETARVIHALMERSTSLHPALVGADPLRVAIGKRDDGKAVARIGLGAKNVVLGEWTAVRKAIRASWKATDKYKARAKAWWRGCCLAVAIAAAVVATVASAGTAAAVIAPAVAAAATAAASMDPSADALVESALVGLDTATKAAVADDVALVEAVDDDRDAVESVGSPTGASERLQADTAPLPPLPPELARLNTAQRAQVFSGWALSQRPPPDEATQARVIAWLKQ